jgi:ADP-heptose:LPS heptosyltransferase
MDDKIGDMIVSTLFYREIKKKIPQSKIYIITGKNAAQVVKYNPYVDNTYIYHSGNNFSDYKKIIKEFKTINFDLFVDMGNTLLKPSVLLMLRLISPRFLLGFNKENYKLFNISIPYIFGSTHITSHYQAIFDFFDFGKINFQYEIFIPDEIKKQADNFYELLPKNKFNIVINPFGASKHRCVSWKQIIEIANNYSENIILVGQEHLLNKLIGAETLPNNIFLCSSVSIDDSVLFSCAIVSKCDLIVTPDTSLLHCAAGYNIPIVGLYRNTIETPGNIL